jgi:hypothetical protein
MFDPPLTPPSSHYEYDASHVEKHLLQTMQHLIINTFLLTLRPENDRLVRRDVSERDNHTFLLQIIQELCTNGKNIDYRIIDDT